MEKKLIQFKKRDMFLREQEEDDSDVKVEDTKTNTGFKDFNNSLGSIDTGSILSLI
jgi:hypothetical protein